MVSREGKGVGGDFVHVPQALSKHGVVPLSSHMGTHAKADIVNVKEMHPILKGRPPTCYRGKTGKILECQTSCFWNCWIKDDAYHESYVRFMHVGPSNEPREFPEMGRKTIRQRWKLRARSLGSPGTSASLLKKLPLWSKVRNLRCWGWFRIDSLQDWCKRNDLYAKK